MEIRHGKIKEIYVNLQHTGYKLVEDAVKFFGGKITSSENKNILFWCDSEGSVDFCRSLQRWQLTNHFPGMWTIAHKVELARNYEKNHEKLVIIAGACQSDYEALIKAGANFASSPKRVNIHALDPAIIASTIALTKTSEQIDVVDLISKTKYGSSGIGGIITNGLMYVGYPR